MITFPEEYVKTRYPGYFWNIKTKKLYSIKTGALKALAFYQGHNTNRVEIPPGYRVSVNGRRTHVYLPYLHSLKPGPATVDIWKPE